MDSQEKKFNAIPQPSSGVPPRHILVTGGSRSGKSSFALSLASEAQTPFFIATGWASDQEMAERIQKHRAERAAGKKQWNVIETRTELIEAIDQALAKNADFILIDCLTLWTSNLFLIDEEQVRDHAKRLAEKIRICPVNLALVTNEVGSGIVPENQLARHYRDAAGFVNQCIGAAVNEVYLSVCGCQIQVK